jgi:diacylglycerol kinase family enzyme
VRVPVDLGAALIDGRLHWFVAHLVARHGWWRGRLVAAMNAEHLGAWDVAPRAHPGDGFLDVVDVSPSFGVGDRLKARSRVRSGTHVPHPLIAERRVPAAQFDLAPPLDVWLDGVRIGPAHSLSVRLEPDALICVV